MDPIGGSTPEKALKGAYTAQKKEEERKALSQLTQREMEVLRLLADGHRVAECAAILNISGNTVENHKAHIMRKLGLHKIVDLVRFAVRHGVVSDE